MGGSLRSSPVGPTRPETVNTLGRDRLVIHLCVNERQAKMETSVNASDSESQSTKNESKSWFSRLTFWVAILSAVLTLADYYGLPTF